MENQHVKRRQLPLSLFVWWILDFVMILAVPIGLGLVVLGILSFVIDLGEGFWGPRLGSAPVRTVADKALFTVAGAVAGILGIGFLWLRRRGYVKGAAIFFAVGLGIYLLITGVRGISGGPFHFGQ
jgi:hypothetical protein